MRLQHVTSASCQEVAQDRLCVLREHQLLRVDSIAGCVLEILLSSHSYAQLAGEAVEHQRNRQPYADDVGDDSDD